MILTTQSSGQSQEDAVSQTLNLLENISKIFLIISKILGVGECTFGQKIPADSSDLPLLFVILQTYINDFHEFNSFYALKSFHQCNHQCGTTAYSKKFLLANIKDPMVYWDVCLCRLPRHYTSCIWWAIERAEKKKQGKKGKCVIFKDYIPYFHPPLGIHLWQLYKLTSTNFYRSTSRATRRFLCSLSARSLDHVSFALCLNF